MALSASTVCSAHVGLYRVRGDIRMTAHTRVDLYGHRHDQLHLAHERGQEFSVRGLSNRGAVGAQIETPKASIRRGVWKGFSPPQPTRSLGKRHN